MRHHISWYSISFFFFFSGYIKLLNTFSEFIDGKMEKPRDYSQHHKYETNLPQLYPQGPLLDASRHVNHSRGEQSSTVVWLEALRELLCDGLKERDRVEFV